MSITVWSAYQLDSYTLDSDGNREYFSWQPCPITLDGTSLSDKKVTLSRVLYSDVERIYDGSYRSLQKLSEAIGAIGNEHPFRHDTMSFSEYSLRKSTSSSDPYKLRTTTFRQVQDTRYLDDEYQGQWRWTDGTSWGTFGITKSWGQYKVGWPWGYNGFHFVEDPNRTNISNFMARRWDSDVLGQGYPEVFDTAEQAFDWAMDNINLYSHHYMSDPERQFSVNRKYPELSEKKPLYGDPVDPEKAGISWALMDNAIRQHPEPLGLESNLVSTAIKQLNFNSNNIANVLAIKELVGSIRHPGKILDGLLSHQNIFKQSANAWLQYRYTYSTTLMDISEGLRYFKKKDTFTCRAGSVNDYGEKHVKVVLTPPGNDSQIDILNKYGLAPDLYNLWDLVPYSFIIDWFIGIGDFLEQVTDYGKALRFNVKSLTSSWKWRDRITVKHDGTETEVLLEYYNRTVTDKLPAFLPYFDEGPSEQTVIRRCLDGLALFVS